MVEVPQGWQDSILVLETRGFWGKSQLSTEDGTCIKKACGNCAVVKMRDALDNADRTFDDTVARIANQSHTLAYRNDQRTIKQLQQVGLLNSQQAADVRRYRENWNRFD